MEINYKEEYSPIKQDINKDGTLRDYNWGDMLFNYGSFPQTWENPHKQNNKISESINILGQKTFTDTMLILNNFLYNETK